MCGMIWSVILIKTKGWQRSFHASMKTLDGGDEVFGGGEGSASVGLAGDAEEDFDHVRPGARCRGKVRRRLRCAFRLTCPSVAGTDLAHSSWLDQKLVRLAT